MQSAVGGELIVPRPRYPCHECTIPELHRVPEVAFETALAVDLAQRGERGSQHLIVPGRVRELDRSLGGYGRLFSLLGPQVSASERDQRFDQMSTIELRDERSELHRGGIERFGVEESEGRVEPCDASVR
jgi:hypothetical protein